MTAGPVAMNTDTILSQSLNAANEGRPMKLNAPWEPESWARQAKGRARQRKGTVVDHREKPAPAVSESLRIMVNESQEIQDLSFGGGAGSNSRTIVMVGAELRVFDVSKLSRDEALSNPDLIIRNGKSEFSHAAISRNGYNIVTSQADGKVCLWDSISGRKLAKYELENEVAKAVGFGRDGTSIVLSQDKSGRGIVRAAEFGKLISRIAFDRIYERFSFSPGCQKIIAWSTNPKSGRLVTGWYTDGKGKACSIRLNSAPSCVEFGANDTVYIGLSSGAVSVHNINTGAKAGAFPPSYASKVVDIAVSSDAKVAGVAYKGGDLEMFDIRSPRSVTGLFAPPIDPSLVVRAERPVPPFVQKLKDIFKKHAQKGAVKEEDVKEEDVETEEDEGKDEAEEKPRSFQIIEFTAEEISQLIR
jgi:hypothetical protein